MNFYLIILGIIFVVTGGELFEIQHFSSSSMTPFGQLGYYVLKIFNIGQTGEMVIAGVFLFVVGVLLIVFGAAHRHQ